MLSSMQLINSLQLFMLLLQLLLLFFLWFWGLSDPLRVIESSGGWPAVAYCGIWILNSASSPSWLKLLVSVQCPTTAEMQRIGHRLPGSYWLKYPRCRLTPNVARGQAMPCNLSKLAAILGCFILLLLLLLLLLAASGSANKKWGQN